MVPVKIAKLDEKARVPVKKTKGSAGYDIFARLDQPLTIAPFGRAAVPTGLAFEIPEKYCISIRPRSGLALNHGVTLPNAPGTIDSDYRGELKILMINLGHEPYSIQDGDSIAQLIIQPTYGIVFQEHEFPTFSGSDRGSRGFGSTGR